MKLTKYEIFVLHKSYQLKILPNKEMLNFKHICEDIKVTYTYGLTAWEFCDIMNFTKSYIKLRDRWFDRNTLLGIFLRRLNSNYSNNLIKSLNCSMIHFQNTTQILKQRILILK